MENNILSKFKSKKGGGLPIIIVFIVVILVINIAYLYDRDNRQYEWWINNFKEGLRTSSKAALLQYDLEETNFEYIAQGYVEGEQDYNHFVFLNHQKSNEVFYKMLKISSKNNYDIGKLQQHTFIAIMEPVRIKDDDNDFLSDDWNYTLTIYKGIQQIYKESNIEKDDLYRIQEIVNSHTSFVKINITSGNLINQIKPRTYHISIIEDLPLEGLFMFNEDSNNGKRINVYYFEGVNAVRSIDMRKGN